MPNHVVRRSDDDHTQIIGHAHRDHVARNPATETNSGVMSADDDVRQHRIGGDLEDYLRVLRHKAASSGASTKEATGGGTVMRRCPAGRSRNALTESTAASNSSNRGRKRISRR